MLTTRERIKFAKVRSNHGGKASRVCAMRILNKCQFIPCKQLTTELLQRQIQCYSSEQMITANFGNYPPYQKISKKAQSFYLLFAINKVKLLEPLSLLSEGWLDFSVLMLHENCSRVYVLELEVTLDQ